MVGFRDSHLVIDSIPETLVALPIAVVLRTFEASEMIVACMHQIFYFLSQPWTFFATDFCFCEWTMFVDEVDGGDKI